MKNFHRISTTASVAPLMHQVMRNPHLWNQHKFRTSYNKTPFSQVDDIWIRFSDLDKCPTDTNAIGVDSNIWYPAAKLLTEVKPLALEMMRAVGAYELGRVLITRLSPGGKMLPHNDNDGVYGTQPDLARYHIVLNGAVGSLFRSGNETVEMRTAEVWWFNAHLEHEVYNGSEEDRVHLLVDVKVWL